MRLIREFEHNPQHWALRISLDFLNYRPGEREMSMTVAIGPWLVSLGVKAYQ